MTNQEIIDSSAFKVLNHMIDQKAKGLASRALHIKDEMNRLYEPGYGGYNTFITVRTHDEGKKQIDLPVNLFELNRLADSIKEMTKLEQEINELQRQKLRLLNDYDFTHGDDSEQKKVFG